MTATTARPAAPLPVTIRPAAEDDDADLEFAVWTMITAATSHLPVCTWYVLLDGPGTEVADVLGRVARSARPHWCHLSRFWIAETADGERAGALTAFDPATEGTHVLTEELTALALELALPDDRLERVLAHEHVLSSCTPAGYPSSWGIENVAVRPEFRGRGVVDALLAHALRLGREGASYEHAQILCLNGNDRAQRTWERHGFTVRADYRSSAFHGLYGCPGLKLLARPYGGPGGA